MSKKVAFQSSALRVRLVTKWAPIGLRVDVGELVGLKMGYSSEDPLASWIGTADQCLMLVVVFRLSL